MKLNDKYTITNVDDKIFLVNIENGDVYQINDVTESIFSNCANFDDVEHLACRIYELFESANEDFSYEDLLTFIHDMIDESIIIL